MSTSTVLTEVLVLGTKYNDAVSNLTYFQEQGIGNAEQSFADGAQSSTSERYCTSPIHGGSIATRQDTPFLTEPVNLLTSNMCQRGVLAYWVIVAITGLGFLLAHIRLYLRRDRPNTMRQGPQWIKRAHRLFVEPFTPSTIGGFALGIFCLFILASFSMPYERIVHNERWVGTFSTILWVPNKVAMILAKHYFKCADPESVSLAVWYLVYPKDKHLDAMLMVHISIGLLWLVLGALQIGLSGGTMSALGRKLHRVFGYISAAVFAAHIVATFYVLWVNSVKHSPLVTFLLPSNLIASIHMLITAIRSMRSKRNKKNTQIHIFLMVLTYLLSTEGAGPIRWSEIWILLLTGLLPKKYQPLLDTTRCQAMYDSQAAYCYAPYTLRLGITNCHAKFFMLVFCGVALRCLKVDRQHVEGLRMYYFQEIKRQIVKTALAFIVLTIFSFVNPQHNIDIDDETRHWRNSVAIVASVAVFTPATSKEMNYLADASGLSQKYRS